MFHRARCLPTSWNRGGFEPLPILGQESFDIAQLSAPPVVLSVAEGFPATAVGVQMPGSPNVIITDASISSPEDLIGRNVAIQVGEFEEALWQAWFVTNGIDRDALDEVPIGDIGADILFIDHQVDVILDFYTSGVIPPLTDGREGDEALFPIRDTLDVIGHVTVVNNDFLAREPEAVRGFRRAWAKGMESTIANPEATVDLNLEQFPENERVATEWSVARYVEAWLSDQAKAGGFLPFTPEMWEATQAVLVNGGLMEEIDLSSLYDDSYLPDPAVMPAE